MDRNLIKNVSDDSKLQFLIVNRPSSVVSFPGEANISELPQARPLRVLLLPLFLCVQAVRSAVPLKWIRLRNRRRRRRGHSCSSSRVFLPPFLSKE